MLDKPPMRASEIYHAAGISSQLANHYLKELVRKGVVLKFQGQYIVQPVLTDAALLELLEAIKPIAQKVAREATIPASRDGIEVSTTVFWAMFDLLEDEIREQNATFARAKDPYPPSKG